MWLGRDKLTQIQVTLKIFANIIHMFCYLCSYNHCKCSFVLCLFSSYSWKAPKKNTWLNLCIYIAAEQSLDIRLCEYVCQMAGTKDLIFPIFKFPTFELRSSYNNWQYYELQHKLHLLNYFQVFMNNVKKCFRTAFFERFANRHDSRKWNINFFNILNI